MARKKNGFGKLLLLGGMAAAGYAAYKNRDLIRGFIHELTSAPEEDFSVYDSDFEKAVEAEAPVEENDIVIDRTTEEE